MLALAGELANPAQTAEARSQAGLQLKQCLTSKDDAVRESYAANWVLIGEDVRSNIKGAVCLTPNPIWRHPHAAQALSTLGTEHSGPSIAAQVIAAVACIEIPQGLWPDVIPTLLQALSSEQANELQKVASLETVGYICEGVVCVTRVS